MPTHYPHIQQPGFVLDVWHWPTVADFRAHLARYRYADTAPWARACIVHHTVKPQAADWRGPASMAGLARHYRVTEGWSAGPHLFVAAGAPNPAHNGIWQLTPLSVPGVHGNAANDWAWGVEHVGRFDDGGMPPDVAALGCGAMAALLDWSGRAASAETLQPHRRYNPTKTCPGRQVDMAAVIRAVVALQAPWLGQPPADAPAPAPAYTAESRIIAPPGLTREQLARALSRRCLRSPYGPDAVFALGEVYSDLCAATGVDPVVACAQLCHETGNLTSARSQPPQHNLAGIGATNDGAQGLSFPTPEAGARAHVGRLIAYALAPGQRFGGQQLLADMALQARPLPLACQGSAPTLRLLGSDPNPVPGCGWAHPGTAYGEALAAVANALVRLI